MTRLGQDEYNLSYLVKSLGDFDPVDVIGDSNDAPVQSIVFVLNITKSLLMLVIGRLRLNIAFDAHKCFFVYSSNYFAGIQNSLYLYSSSSSVS